MTTEPETPITPQPQGLTVEQAFQNVAGAVRYGATNLVQLALQRGPLDQSLAVIAAALQPKAAEPSGRRGAKK